MTYKIELQNRRTRRGKAAMGDNECLFVEWKREQMGRSTNGVFVHLLCTIVKKGLTMLTL
ncbi:MAG: hypothetical protein OEW15_14745 [Nitrospirota bacterium]|nr:hypothetical protein [Nitrospirota bacterium]